jgi:hypothetical protein
MIYSLKTSVDDNGNKQLTVSNGNSRGFSVQTNGNLPKTHAMPKGKIDEGTALEELRGHVSIWGTQYQRNYLGC